MLPLHMVAELIACDIHVFPLSWFEVDLFDMLRNQSTGGNLIYQPLLLSPRTQGMSAQV